MTVNTKKKILSYKKCDRGVLEIPKKSVTYYSNQGFGAVAL